MAGFMGAERHIKSMHSDVNSLKRLLLSRKLNAVLVVMLSFSQKYFAQ